MLTLCSWCQVWLWKHFKHVRHHLNVTINETETDKGTQNPQLTTRKVSPLRPVPPATMIIWYSSGLQNNCADSLKVNLKVCTDCISVSVLEQVGSLQSLHSFIPLSKSQISTTHPKLHLSILTGKLQSVPEWCRTALWQKLTQQEPLLFCTVVTLKWLRRQSLNVSTEQVLYRLNTNIFLLTLFVVKWL